MLVTSRQWNLVEPVSQAKWIWYRNCGYLWRPQSHCKNWNLPCKEGQNVNLTPVVRQDPGIIVRPEGCHLFKSFIDIFVQLFKAVPNTSVVDPGHPSHHQGQPQDEDGLEERLGIHQEQKEVGWTELVVQTSNESMSICKFNSPDCQVWKCRFLFKSWWQQFLWSSSHDNETSYFVSLESISELLISAPGQKTRDRNPTENWVPHANFAGPKTTGVHFRSLNFEVELKFRTLDLISTQKGASEVLSSHRKCLKAQN